MPPRVAALALAALALSPLACGGGERAGAIRADSSAPTGTSDASPGAIVLSPTDLDVYRRGLEAQVEAVRRAADALTAARSAADTLAALDDARPQRTEAAAAAAAGVSLGRFRRVDGAVDAVLRAISSTAMYAAMDTSSLPPNERAQVNKNIRDAEEGAYRGVPPENVRLVRPRAPALDSLRAQLAALRIALARR